MFEMNLLCWREIEKLNFKFMRRHEILYSACIPINLVYCLVSILIKQFYPLFNHHVMQCHSCGERELWLSLGRALTAID